MLEAVNLSKTYGDHQALKSLNLSVKEGEIYCLLGANGAGKSTTINLFMHFIRPSTGAAFIGGVNVSSDPLKARQMLSYIPENLMLYGELSGLENLDFFCRLGGKDFDGEQLTDMLINAGLQQDFIRKAVKTYSKGMRQKVGIALATARASKVLLLDEPTSGLDPKSSNEFSELLLRLKEEGVATLMATHDLFRAKDTGSRIGIMKEGVLLEDFHADELDVKDLESLYLQHMHNS